MRGLNDLFKQASELQASMQKTQQELSKKRIKGESGGGLVKIMMTGRHEALRVSIDESLMEEDKEILEDLVVAAINDCIKRVEEANAEVLEEAASGLNLSNLPRFS